MSTLSHEVLYLQEVDKNHSKPPSTLRSGHNSSRPRPEFDNEVDNQDIAQARLCSDAHESTAQEIWSVGCVAVRVRKAVSLCAFGSARAYACELAHMRTRLDSCTGFLLCVYSFNAANY
eukprot:4827979-Amphidinium_carterae.2